MKKTVKTLITLGLVLAMALTMLTGCTPSKDSTVLTVDGSSMTFAEANFYARYNQSMTELYAQYYGSSADEMWAQYVDTDMTYEDSVKADIQEDLEEMMLLEQHMSEYEVEITDEDKESITEAATEFIEDNSEEALNVMTADQETVERILTLATIRSRVISAIEAQADTEVSDEEALRKKLMYVEFPYTMTVYNTDDSEENEELSEIIDTMTSSSDVVESSVAQEQADDAYDKLKDATDEDTFTSIAEEAELTASSANIGEGTTTPSEAIVEQAMDMEVGVVSEPILDEDASAYYVVMLANDYDEDATESAKTTIVSQRQSDLYDETYEGFKESATITWNEKKWSKISFIDQGCVYEVTPAELLDDPELTVEDGDTVSIEYEGTIDGVAFDGGTGSSDELVIGSDTMIPGFEDGIIGHHPGETFTIDVTFPEDYGDEELNGKDAQFEITLNGIYED